MTREEAIMSLQHTVDRMNKEKGNAIKELNRNGKTVDIICRKEALEMGIEALKEQKAKWIPCSERLPEEIGTYLVTLEYKEHGTGVTILWYHGKQFGWDLRVADVVLAWMPCTEPYKEGQT